MVETSLKLLQDDSFSSCLQCPICIEYFTIPIYQCDSGHSICDKCSQRTAKCPTCRANIGRKLRNFHLEQQLQALSCVCKYPGCNQKMKLSERVFHQQNCSYNPSVNCLLLNCKWTGHKDQMLNHLSTKHKIPHYDICGMTAEYSSRLRSMSLPSTAGCVKLLHTFYFADNQTATVLTYIFMDSAKNLFYPQFRTLGPVPVRFTLRIWNTESEDSEEVVLVGKASNVKYSLDEERDTKNCIAFDLESLIKKFAFQDKLEADHQLLHYRLSIEPGR